MPPKKAQPEYCIITSLKNKGILGARVLSRGEPFLSVDVTVDKRIALPPVGTIVMCDMTDADAGTGTADVLEVITDAKELKQLRKNGSIPPEEEYAEFVFIKETFEGKSSKTKGSAKKGGKDHDEENGEEGGSAAIAAPSGEGGSAEADAKKNKDKKDKASPKGTPKMTPKMKGNASPVVNSSKTSLEQQMAKLDLREGNADLDDI